MGTGNSVSGKCRMEKYPLPITGSASHPVNPGSRQKPCRFADKQAGDPIPASRKILRTPPAARSPGPILALALSRTLTLSSVLWFVRWENRVRQRRHRRRRRRQLRLQPPHPRQSPTSRGDFPPYVVEIQRRLPPRHLPSCRPSDSRH